MHMYEYTVSDIYRYDLQYGIFVYTWYLFCEARQLYRTDCIMCACGEKNGELMVRFSGMVRRFEGKSYVVQSSSVRKRDSRSTN